jgi:hypothetical protein
VPEIAPLEEPESPGGSPAIDHVYGCVPPFAMSAAVYDWPTAALPSALVVMVTDASVTMMLTDPLDAV